MVSAVLLFNDPLSNALRLNLANSKTVQSNGVSMRTRPLSRYIKEFAHTEKINDKSNQSESAFIKRSINSRESF